MVVRAPCSGRKGGRERRKRTASLTPEESLLVVRHARGRKGRRKGVTALSARSTPLWEPRLAVSKKREKKKGKRMVSLATIFVLERCKLACARVKREGEGALCFVESDTEKKKKKGEETRPRHRGRALREGGHVGRAGKKGKKKKGRSGPTPRCGPWHRTTSVKKRKKKKEEENAPFCPLLLLSWESPRGAMA